MQRRLVLAAGGLLGIVLLWVAIVAPLMALEESWSQELKKKQLLLAKYQALQREKGAVTKAAQEVKRALTQAEGQLLTGGNPAVASADLQEIIKNLTKALGVQVTSTKVLPPQESGIYLEIPVEIQLALSIDQLVGMLYRLENHQKLLLVTQLEINAPRRRRPMAGYPAAGQEAQPLRAVLVVEGLIKKGTGA